MKRHLLIIMSGLSIGALAVILVLMGNPGNYGVCIACMLRDISGALGLHRAAVVQYLRPEIIGMGLGAFVAAIATKEFRTTGGSSPILRFSLGFVGMIGMLVFLGCPVRTVLRLAGGDLNAGVGLIGLIVGIVIGTYFLIKGFSLGRTAKQPPSNGYVFPLLVIGLLLLALAAPAFIFISQEGPGSMHAPLLISLGAGLFIGIIAQRSRLCMAGGIRDLIFFKDFHLMYGFLAVFVAALIGNLLVGSFKLGFTGQPLAHTDGLWNFLGMLLAGFTAVLLGGCPLRQLVSASEGNTDSAITVLGIIAGAAFAHNFGLAASGNGVPLNGKFAVVIGLVFTFVIAFAVCKFKVGGDVKYEKGSGCQGSILS
ncbi:YedE family putative selenium transporter [Desulforamulus aquiferis]|uniref:YedE family putative selenium transporter n=1 Tax=Desulforamulus aquiferis TaxID=1397668 RepID=UPI003570C274